MTNSGNVPLHDVTVTDPMLGGPVCTIAELAAGAVGSCEDSYIVQPADIGWPQLHNVASVTGADDDPTLVDPVATASADVPTGPPIARWRRCASSSRHG